MLSIVWTAVATHRLSVLRLAEGAPVNARNPETGDTPLNAAARNGHAEVAQMLLAHEAELDVRDRSGATPLENAARSQHGEVVKLLLSKGAAASGDVMEDAVLKGQEDIVEILLAGGCDAKTRSKSGAPPLDSAALKGNIEIAIRMLRKLSIRLRETERRFEGLQADGRSGTPARPLRTSPSCERWSRTRTASSLAGKTTCAPSASGFTT
jgi:ankyrin repeat protein